MQRMNQETREKGNSKMIKMNIAEFLAAARQHLLGLSAAQPAFATLPAQVRRAR
jgi:hypothetical protein